MCIEEIPKLLFYTHMPTLFLAVVITLFVFFANRKSAVNVNMALFTGLFCFWIVIDLFSWLAVNNARVSLFLARISVLEIVSLFFFFNFVLYFVGKNIKKKTKIIFFIPFLPIFIFIFSDHNVYQVNSCENANGSLYLYVYLIAAFYSILSITLLIKHFLGKDTEKNVKKQIKIIIFSVIFIVLWFIGFLLVLGYLNKIEYPNVGEIDQFMSIGIVVFIGMLTYAITKYQFLNIKLISAQALTYSIWVLIASQFFFIENELGIIIASVTLIFSVVFGIMLIRGIKEEIKRKEELQIMADRLAIANDELRKLDNAKTEFISIASHQLRTPLTAIKGFVSLLLEGAYGEVNPEAREAINKIHLSGERLIRLVEDLLNVSRIEAGRMIFEKKPGQLEDVVKEICEGLEMLAREKNLYLDWKLPKEKLPSFDFDASKMKEVVSNLVENAIKYSDKGGVTVRVERTQQTTNDKSQDGGNQEIIRFTVSDTGIGIPADEIPNLFKKFSRGKNTKRLNATGTGLGLFVVKNIVENHGGKIWIESKGEGMGTKFVVELPVANAGL